MSTNSPAPRLVDEWSPALIATLAHAAVQHSVLAQIAAPGGQNLHRHVEAVLPLGLAPMHRLIVIQRVGQALSVWHDTYDPRPHWQPLGIEAVAGKARIELVWISATGAIRADRLTCRALNARARCDAGRVYDAGESIFGAAWMGVRLISLQPSSIGCEHIGHRSRR